MDVALVFSNQPGKAGFIDVAMDGSDLKKGDELKTAIILSLFTNRRAEDDDVLPLGETDRQGCWIDQFSEKDGDKYGSRLWLLKQTKQTQDTLNKAEEYALEALQWLIEDGIATDLTVEASFPRTYVIGIAVSITHGDGTDSRYEFLWDEIAEDPGANVSMAPIQKPVLTLGGLIFVTNTGLKIAVS